MVWVPRYIKQTIAKRPGQIVSSEDWNDLFNLLIGQGDYTAEGLLTAVTTFTNNLTTKADLVSGKIPLEQIPEIFKPAGLDVLITTVNNLAVAVPANKAETDKRLTDLEQHLLSITLGGV